MFRFRLPHNRLLLFSGMLFLGWVADPCLGKSPKQSNNPPVNTAPVCRYLSGRAEATYVGSETCKMCHREQYDKIVDSRHWLAMTSIPAAVRAAAGLPREAGCESCHGPGSAHVEAGGDKTLIFNFPRFSSNYCNPCQACHSSDSLMAAAVANQRARFRPPWSP